MDIYIVTKDWVDMPAAPVMARSRDEAFKLLEEFGVLMASIAEIPPEDLVDATTATPGAIKTITDMRGSSGSIWPLKV